MQFYLSVYCRSCDEEIVYGPCLTTIEVDIFTEGQV